MSGGSMETVLRKKEAKFPPLINSTWYSCSEYLHVNTTITTIEVLFDYEITHRSKSQSKEDNGDMTEEVKELENMMLVGTAEKLKIDESCDKVVDMDERHGNATKSRELRGKKDLTMAVALSSEPLDKFDDVVVECQLPSPVVFSDLPTSCSPYNGRMSVSYAFGTNEQGLVSSINKFIKDGMKKGSFLNESHNTIISVAFVGTRLAKTGRDELFQNVVSASNSEIQAANNRDDDDDKVTPEGTAFAFFLCFTALIFLIVLVRRARNTLRERSEKRERRLAGEVGGKSVDDRTRPGSSEGEGYFQDEHGVVQRIRKKEESEAIEEVKKKGGVKNKSKNDVKNKLKNDDVESNSENVNESNSENVNETNSKNAVDKSKKNSKGTKSKKVGKGTKSKDTKAEKSSPEFVIRNGAVSDEVEVGLSPTSEQKNSVHVY